MINLHPMPNCQPESPQTSPVLLLTHRRALGHVDPGRQSSTAGEAQARRAQSNSPARNSKSGQHNFRGGRGISGGVERGERERKDLREEQNQIEGNCVSRRV